MKLTKKDAYELTIKLWTYLQEHPEIQSKSRVVEKVFPELSNMICYCPLCELFSNSVKSCSKCPLNYCLSGPYGSWCMSSNNEERQIAAGQIVDQMKEALRKLNKKYSYRKKK